MAPSLAPRSRLRGVMLMLGAGLCWSLGGIIVRKLLLQDVWVIVFWRALFMALFLGALLLVLRGRGAAVAVRAIGRAGMISSLCLALQIYCFILALKNTTAANTFVLMSLSPLTAAVAGRLFLHERIARHTWIAIGGALCGILIMFGDGMDRGHWLGNFFALCVPLAYACQILFVRKVRGGQANEGGAPDLLPTVFVAGVMALVPAMFLGWPLQASAHDLLLLAVMGCVQLGLGCWLMTMAVRHLRAAEMGLLALVETILAPLWVWLGAGEVPGGAALAGGALIVVVLAANAGFTLRAERDRQPSGSSA